MTARFVVVKARERACQGTEWNWTDNSIGHAVRSDLGPSLTKTRCGIRVGDRAHGWSNLVPWYSAGHEAVTCKRCQDR